MPRRRSASSEGPPASALPPSAGGLHQVGKRPALRLFLLARLLLVRNRILEGLPEGIDARHASGRVSASGPGASTASF